MRLAFLHTIHIETPNRRRAHRSTTGTYSMQTASPELNYTVLTAALTGSLWILMKRFIEAEERSQVALLPHCPDDFIGEDNPVRVVDAFVGDLELDGLGFDGTRPADTGRSSYRPPCCSRSTSTCT
jgi:hypothetical protein